MTSITEYDAGVVIPYMDELTVTAVSWETSQPRERVSDGKMWTHLIVSFYGVQVPVGCLLNIEPLEPTLKRAPRQVQLAIRDGQFVISALFVGSYGIGGKPWAICHKLKTGSVEISYALS